MAKQDKQPEDFTPEAEDQMTENTPDPQAAEKAEKAERGPIDRITNQPLSDFLGAGFDEKHADSVDVLNSAVVTRQGSAARTQLIARSIDAADREAEEAERAKEDMKRMEESTRQMFKEINYVPPDVYLARENARVRAEAATLGTSSIRPGGEFIVNGVKVDANGDAI